MSATKQPQLDRSAIEAEARRMAEFYTRVADSMSDDGDTGPLLLEILSDTDNWENHEPGTTMHYLRELLWSVEHQAKVAAAA